MVKELAGVSASAKAIFVVNSMGGVVASTVAWAAGIEPQANKPAIAKVPTRAGIFMPML